MHSAPSWLIALTVVFAVAAAMFAARALSTPDRQRRVLWVLHAGAAMAMAFMLWPAGMAVSPVLYLMLFTIWGLCVVFVGIGQPPLPHWAHHAALMGAMAAMPIMMSGSSAGVDTATTAAHRGHHPEMVMAPSAEMTMPTWLRWSAVGLAGLLSLSVVWWFYLIVRGPERPYPDLLMAMGMAASFVLFL